MEILTFKTIAEKQNAYVYTKIESFSDLLNILQESSNDSLQSTYYRGHADGSWKIYSSMQREWLVRGLNQRFQSYTEVIKRFLTYVKENHSDKLQNYCKNLSDIDIFSVLQHYGAPTPFIDWTLDYNVALFFATYNLNENHTQFETNSYVSVYWFNEGIGAQTPYNDATDFGKMRKDFLMIQKECGTNPSIIKKVLDGTDNISLWNRLPWIFSNKYSDFISIENLRQVLQNGVFVYINDDQKSLDNLFAGRMSSYPKIHCLDIHKSFLPQIKKYLEKQKISAKSLGINSENWGKKIFHSFLEGCS